MKPSAELLNSLEKATTAYEAHIELAADYLKARGFRQATALSCRLGVVVDPEPGHESMVGRLAIPYITPAGPVSMKFRSLDDSEPKYLSHPGVPPRLYGVQALFVDSPHVAICEGELDAAILTHQLDIPAVGCPGVSSWQPHFSRMFAGYDKVFILADGDKPGLEFAKRVADDLDNAIIRPMAPGQDVNSTLVRDGADALKERIGL